MFYFLHKNTLLQWLILIMLACFVTFKLITHPILQLPEGAPFLYHSIYSSLSTNSALFVVVIGCILVLQIILLQIYFLRNHFLGKFSLLPAIFYLGLLSCDSFLAPVTPAFFSNLCAVIVLNLIHDYTPQSVKSRALLAGIITGIGICIDLASAILMVFIITSFVMNLFSKIKNILISIIGLITSFIYVITYFFLTDKLPVLLENLREIRFLHFFNCLPSFSPISTISFSIIISILLYIIVKIALRYKNKLVILRKKVLTLNVFFINSFLAIFFTLLSYPSFFQYLFLPLAVYLTLFTQERNRFFLNEITFLILIVALCL